jgi:hypothetical protein
VAKDLDDIDARGAVLDATATAHAGRHTEFADEGLLLVVVAIANAVGTPLTEVVAAGTSSIVRVQA